MLFSFVRVALISVAEVEAETGCLRHRYQDLGEMQIDGAILISVDLRTYRHRDR